MVAPVIPALNDMEIERILEAARTAGVKEAGYVLLRLPLEVRDLFREWLTANYPDRHRHVFKLIRDMRGGKDYDSTWGTRMKGTGPYAWMIGRRFEMACEKLGLNDRQGAQLTTEHFRAPKGRLGATQPVRMSVPSAKLTAVTLGVRDLPASARFYEALGFERKFRATGDEIVFFRRWRQWFWRCGIWMSSPRTQAFLRSHSRTAFAARPSPGIANFELKSMLSSPKL